jgi:nicotinate phosphoribosyltransferase
MSPRRRKRLDPSVFQLPIEQIRAGDYSDRYVALAGSAAPKGVQVTLQIATKNGGVLSGIDETIAILKGAVPDWSALTVSALYEGDPIEAWDTVLTIEGEYAAFAQLETACLGTLAHRTRVCTNVRSVVDAARPKPVFFFGARDAHWTLQPGDGFAAMIGGAKEVGTAAQAQLWAGKVGGTMSHSLVAACGGDTVSATKRLAKLLPEDVPIIALVDYDNDCVKTSLDVARALGDRLWGVRLDTSQHMVDKSVLAQLGTFRPTGVNVQLAWNVRNALDDDGHGDVHIVASGGFDAARVREFEEAGAPVDAYGIGACAYRGAFDFTADVVRVNGKPESRVGRRLVENPKLERVK